MKKKLFSLVISSLVLVNMPTSPKEIKSCEPCSTIGSIGFSTFFGALSAGTLYVAAKMASKPIPIIFALEAYRVLGGMVAFSCMSGYISYETAKDAIDCSGILKHLPGTNKFVPPFI